MASCLRAARTAADQPWNALVTRACCVRLTARPSNRLRVRLSANHVRHVLSALDTTVILSLATAAATLSC